MRCTLTISVTLLLFFTSISNAEDFSDVPVIDTHIHLYDTARKLPWPPKDDQVLYRPVLPKHFDEVAEENGITATVIVEASEWLPDNQWVLAVSYTHLTLPTIYSV